MYLSRESTGQWFGDVVKSQRMKTSITEVGLPTHKGSTVQLVLEQCLLDSENVFVGHQASGDRALFMVRLLPDTFPCHFNILSYVSLAQMIDRGQVIPCSLFKVTFKDERYRGIRSGSLLHAEVSWLGRRTKNSTYHCLTFSHLDKEHLPWSAGQTARIQWIEEL